ncbi:hypothetical protein BC332_26507 [Capsicum chinense]|nr:hypothetical protein BC332_26507 [Capsicum chinense]
MALEVYKKIFPKEHCWDRHKEIQPSLVILYFGGNDSQDPDFPNSSHGPLHEYVENMRKLAHHIKIIGGMLFVETLRNKVKLMYLHFLANLSKVDQYASGAATPDIFVVHRKRELESLVVFYLYFRPRRDPNLLVDEWLISILLGSARAHVWSNGLIHDT